MPILISLVLSHLLEAAKECRIILDTVESALPNGMPEGIGEDCKLQEMVNCSENKSLLTFCDLKSLFFLYIS